MPTVATGIDTYEVDLDGSPCQEGRVNAADEQNWQPGIPFKFAGHDPDGVQRFDIVGWLATQRYPIYLTLPNPQRRMHGTAAGDFIHGENDPLPFCTMIPGQRYRVRAANASFSQGDLLEVFSILYLFQAVTTGLARAEVLEDIDLTGLSAGQGLVLVRAL